ncbi:proton-coupled zinc antiporter SLC30A1-like [Mustelus asterias]
MAACGVNAARWLWILLLSVSALLGLIFSQLSDSLTLLLDSFHCLPVLFELAMPPLADWLARRPAPSSHTFAWERLAPVGVLVADVLSLSLCCSVSVAAMARLLAPHPFHRPVLPIAAGTAGIFLNLGVHLWLRSVGNGRNSSPRPDSGQDQPDTSAENPQPKDKDVTGCRREAEAIRGTADRGAHGKRAAVTSGWEILVCLTGVAQSVLNSVLALVVGLLHSLPVPTTGSWHRDSLPYLDPGFSLLTAVVLVTAVAPRLKVSVLLLLECVPAQLDLRRLSDRLTAVSGVVAVHELHVWRLSARRVVASAHVQCRSLAGFARLAGDLRRVFDSEGIHSVTLQPEVINPAVAGGNPTTSCQLACGPDCATKLCCDWPEGA